MKVSISALYITFKKLPVNIEFSDYNYIFGKIGAGKSTILRLIDFCLGGNSEYLMTPAMQQEFVKATIKVEIGDREVQFTRNSGSNDIAAEWNDGESSVAVLAPVKSSSGEVLEGTGVEVFSDLFFYLANIVPPRVRRSRIKAETSLIRLSLRQLMWYCYLDQETIDSSFFYLDADASPFKRENSKNVLRYILGVHQEKVAELEAELTRLSDARRAAEEGAASLKEVLSEVEIGTELEIQAHIRSADHRLAVVQEEITEVRKEKIAAAEHAVEEQREKARNLSNEVEGVVAALAKVEEIVESNVRYRNELRSLRARLERTTTAMDILSGLDFESCPRCGHNLPERTDSECKLCGQERSHDSSPAIGKDAAVADVEERVYELEGIIDKRMDQRSRLERDLGVLRSEKSRLDNEINQAMKEYDSAYLSSILGLERESATILERKRHLGEMLELRHRVGKLEEKASHLEVNEKKVRKELKDAREEAEKDSRNIDRLKTLFLDCLVRSKIPGISASDTVDISGPHYLPEIMPHQGGELATSSFSNLGSGGKKTLFKCCFALALHRLSAEIGANLPTILILDSPMKNISERENQDEFRAFHGMLVELSQTELAETQIFVVDKELFEVPESYTRLVFTRHMDPNSDTDPPLIPYYRGS